MNKYTVVFLFGTGVLLGASNFFSGDDRIPIYIAAFVLVLVPVYFLADFEKRKLEEDEAEKILSTISESHRARVARNEVKSKIPKNSPRRESQAAFEGSTKLGSTRSMAMLVRKPRLREKILEICDFADMVLETIRRMPADTPAAVEFAEKHLAKLNEALAHCFEMSRCEEYKHAPPSLDAQERECFSAVITIFRKQQDNILFEGRDF
ncbi:MAG: hypothetical protein LBK91_06950 [Synergistaceae bacterium]|jgi:hypothetical protein|nr:hypothetical protein [Synergistaceae bacterium]